MPRPAPPYSPHSIRRRSSAFCWFERMVLGAGMSMMAFVLERRLLRALKRGSVEPAPRTAVGTAGQSEPTTPASELSTAPREVGD